MSRFLRPEYGTLVPYVPGEQPKGREYIKLNTNESPFPPHPDVVKAAKEAAQGLNLYCDPDNAALTKVMADYYGVDSGCVLMTNGSDEILNFAFVAFCHAKCPALFPDVTYGFYPVFADINRVPYETIPVNDDMSINPEDYYGAGKTIFIANPNAPTGIFLERDRIEEIIKRNPDNVVVVDEAYIDFGGESCVPLTKEYDNLLVTQTFSKSRSMAGARLGMGIANEKIIQDLNTVKFSLNPYNVNSMTGAAGIAAMKNSGYYEQNCRVIIENRDYATRQLRKLGFEVNNSLANFVFAKHKSISGEDIYLKLREKGVLVRHFTPDKIKDYNRISIGTRDQMEALIRALEEITEETK